jgi:hypothetical protein
MSQFSKTDGWSLLARLQFRVSDKIPCFGRNGESSQNYRNWGEEFLDAFPAARSDSPDPIPSTDPDQCRP